MVKNLQITRSYFYWRCSSSRIVRKRYRICKAYFFYKRTCAILSKLSNCNHLVYYCFNILLHFASNAERLNITKWVCFISSYSIWWCNIKNHIRLRWKSLWAICSKIYTAWKQRAFDCVWMVKDVSIACCYCYLRTSWVVWNHRWISKAWVNWYKVWAMRICRNCDTIFGDILRISILKDFA